MKATKKGKDYRHNKCGGSIMVGGFVNKRLPDVITATEDGKLATLFRVIKGVKGCCLKCKKDGEFITSHKTEWKYKTISKPSKQIKMAKKNKVKASKYSDKAFVVYGETKPLREKLKELRGGFNYSLKDGNGNRFCGWVFSLKHKDRVLEALNIKRMSKLN